MDTNDISVIKAGMKAVWMAGDFGQIAKRNEEEAERFVQRLNIKPGMRVLDVACGTGNVSIPAAKNGAQVTGADIATNLLEQARARAKAEGVADRTDFVEGDAEQLQFPDASFDAVTTMYGAMFAPRPELTAKELLRVCRPGGFVAMANWTPEGFVGEFFKLGSKYVPPPPGIEPPVRWGSEDVVRERFQKAARALNVAKIDFVLTRRMHVMKPEGTPADVVQMFINYFGPTKVAFSKLDATGQDVMRQDLIALWKKYDQSEAGSQRLLVEAEYLEVIVKKG